MDKIGFLEVLGILVVMVVTIWLIFGIWLFPQNAFGQELSDVTTWNLGYGDLRSCRPT